MKAFGILHRALPENARDKAKMKHRAEYETRDANRTRVSYWRPGLHVASGLMLCHDPEGTTHRTVEIGNRSAPL